MTMAEDTRLPELIKDELSRLHKAMSATQHYLTATPDDRGLIINLTSLQAREDELIKELGESLKRRQEEPFDLKINGDEVKNHNISLLFFGEVAHSFQELLTLLAYTEVYGPPSATGQIPNDIYIQARADIVTMASGSFKVVLSNSTVQVGDSLLKEGLQQLNELISTGSNEPLLKTKIKKYGPRTINKYKDLLNVITKYRAELTLYETIKPAGFDTISIGEIKALDIIEIIERETPRPEIISTFKGILMGIDYTNDRIKFDTGTKPIIEAKFDEKLSSKINAKIHQHCIGKFKITEKVSDMFEQRKYEYELLEIDG